jgi:hypothetical protein
MFLWEKGCCYSEVQISFDPNFLRSMNEKKKKGDGEAFSRGHIKDRMRLAARWLNCLTHWVYTFCLQAE